MRIEKCTSVSDRQLIVDGINEYNDSQTTRIIPEVWQPVEFVARNEKNEIVGGILGGIGYYAGLKISVLWVSKKARGTGLGSRLLETAEREGKRLGATMVILDTFSFQAEDFYLKNGYEIFGKIDNYPKEGQSFIFLKKSL